MTADAFAQTRVVHVLVGRSGLQGIFTTRTKSTLPGNRGVRGARIEDFEQPSRRILKKRNDDSRGYKRSRRAESVRSSGRTRLISRRSRLVRQFSAGRQDSGADVEALGACAARWRRSADAAVRTRGLTSSQQSVYHTRWPASMMPERQATPTRSSKPLVTCDPLREGQEVRVIPLDGRPPATWDSRAYGTRAAASRDR